ncbi:replicative DNA helicase [Saccharopolyspora sp. NPDC002376]
MNEPIQARDAERSLVGAALQWSSAYVEACTLISCEDLFRPVHQSIWSAIAEVDERADPAQADTVSRAIAVSQELHRRGELEKVGGAAYMADLAAEAPVPSSARYLAKQVAEAAKLRQIVEVSHRIALMAYGGAESGDVAEHLDGIRQLADSAASGAARAADVADPDELTDHVLELLASPAPETTPMGWPDLDALMGGMEAGQMIGVAARPGVGKTVLSLGAAINVARRGGRVAYFSLEMLREDLAQRCIANLGRVNLKAMRDRALTESDWGRLQRAADEFRQLPLHLSDRATITAAGIRSTCRELARTYGGLDLVVVDYLQLTNAADSRLSREQQVSGLSRSLKLLAMELRVPVIAVSQLNRGPEQRQDKKPQLSDLRESGAIEQDCDKVLLLHHDAENEIKAASELEVIVAKNRQGSTGSATLAWNPQYGAADSLSRQEAPARWAA